MTCIASYHLNFLDTSFHHKKDNFPVVFDVIHRTMFLMFLLFNWFIPFMNEKLFTSHFFLPHLHFLTCFFRNFALAYYMRENNCFPPGLQLQDCLDFYFQVYTYSPRFLRYTHFWGVHWLNGSAQDCQLAVLCSIKIFFNFCYNFSINKGNVSRKKLGEKRKTGERW